MFCLQIWLSEKRFNNLKNKKNHPTTTKKTPPKLKKEVGKVFEVLCYTNSHKAASESEAASATAKQPHFITLEPHFRAQAACLSTFIVPHHHGQTCCSLTLGSVDSVWLCRAGVFQPWAWGCCLSQRIWGISGWLCHRLKLQGSDVAVPAMNAQICC